MSSMSDSEEKFDAGDLGGSSLADAIAEHMALKKEHGADPAELEAELESALAPANRDEDDSVDLHPAEAETVVEPEPPTEAEPEPVAVEPEPQPEPEPVPQRIAAEPVVAEAVVEEAVVEDSPEPEPVPKDYAPGEITGTIEFEWEKEEQAAAADSPATESAAEHDVLEDVPDFFEETPEHDKLWFDEAPPRKFEF